uniref:BACK domain-containing protein n=1 Tax=Oryzias melastigma TaxID=30732 RepID=A0A3B3DS09_ORYME
MLCGGLRESREDVVWLRGISGWVLESILHFFYTGRLWLDWSRIWELTTALLQFQLEGALSLCTDFLRERMDEGSCADVLVLAETHGLVQLGQAAEEYVLTHFQKVSAEESFRAVPLVLLSRLLQKDSLCVESEMEVFRAVVSWVEDQPEDRLPSLPDLLRHVRTPLLSRSELQEALHCPLLHRSPGARGAVETVQHLPVQVLALVGGDTVDDDFMKRVPSRTVWSAQRFHRGPGLIRAIEWKCVTNIPEPARFRHCVCLLNSKLYVLGGRKYYGSLDLALQYIFLRFDVLQKKWEELPDMLRQRDYFSAVCLGGRIYVLGGSWDYSQCLNEVESYRPEENSWRMDHPLDTAVCGHAAAVLEGQIYISGGCDSHHRCLPIMCGYDPVRGCFPRAPMSVGAGRAGHAMLVLGSRLVVTGGLQPLCPGFGDQLLCEVYDPQSDSWSSFPALPRPHLSPGATVHDGRLYVVGGSSADTARDSKWVHCYDPKKGCWENLGAMPFPYTDLAVCFLPSPDPPVKINSFLNESFSTK